MGGGTVYIGFRSSGQLLPSSRLWEKSDNVCLGILNISRGGVKTGAEEKSWGALNGTFSFRS